MIEDGNKLFTIKHFQDENRHDESTFKPFMGRFKIAQSLGFFNSKFIQ